MIHTATMRVSPFDLLRYFGLEHLLKTAKASNDPPKPIAIIVSFSMVLVDGGLRVLVIHGRIALLAVDGLVLD